MRNLTHHLVINILCLLSVKSEELHTFSRITFVRGSTSTFNTGYDLIIDKCNFCTKIILPNRLICISEPIAKRFESLMDMTSRGNSKMDYKSKTFPYLQLWKVVYPNVIYNKRARSGFVGMRGKRNNGFIEFGKIRSSEYFNIRGKKYPYELRGKFVGVRGKKISPELTNRIYLNLNFLRKEMNINELTWLVLHEPTDRTLMESKLH